MRGRLAAAFLTVGAAGCAGTADLAGQPPPSLERAIAALRAGQTCAASYEAQPGQFLDKGDVIVRCPAVFPQALQDAGISGACRSIMDITPEGRVANLESRCNADVGYSHGDYEKDWLTFAEGLFQASTDRSFEDFRLAPDAIGPGERRTDLSAATYFAFEGEPKPEWLLPERFERKLAD